MVEKTYEAKGKKMMSKHIDNQAFTLSPTHNLKHAQCKLEK
jgi:hypothetical protein